MKPNLHSVQSNDGTQATSEAGCDTQRARPHFRGARLERLAYGHTLAHELLSRANAADHEAHRLSDVASTFAWEQNFARYLAADREWQRSIRRFERVTAWLYRMERDTRDHMLVLENKLFRDISTK